MGHCFFCVSTYILGRLYRNSPGIDDFKALLPASEYDTGMVCHLASLPFGWFAIWRVCQYVSKFSILCVCLLVSCYCEFDFLSSEFNSENFGIVELQNL
jgi:hypothetical protein